MPHSKCDDDLKKSIVALYQSRKPQSQLSKELQKRNAILEEENLILKKAIAIFTPHSDRG